MNPLENGVLRIPEFRMLIDAPADCGLASQDGTYLFGPMHGQFGLGVTLAVAADDPDGELLSMYELMAALGPVGEHGATMLNRPDPQVPFLGAIRNPNTSQLFLLPPYNHAKLTEKQLRQECGRLLACVEFVSPAMERWTNLLSNASLLAADTYQRNIGGGEGYSVEERYVFHLDGTFQWLKDFHFSVSGSGLSASRTSREQLAGSWDVVNQNQLPVLRLDDSNGQRSVLTLQQTGQEIRLDGRRFLLDRR